MALTKETIIDKIEILDTGHVQVRRATYFLEDGVRVSEPQYHRTAYEPGASVDHEDARVKAHAKAAWTPKVVAAHQKQRLTTQGV